MTLHIPISSVSQSGPNPGTIVLGPTVDNPSGDWSAVFQGQHYRDSAGVTQTFYRPDGTLRPAPGGSYRLVPATTFTVAGNPSYNGRYTVYTQRGTEADPSNHSSTFGGGLTSVKVTQPVGRASDAQDLFNTGYISSVSTYYLLIVGEPPVIVPPGTVLDDRPIPLVGADTIDWGGISQQATLRLVQHFASTEPPANPYLGQQWYDLTTGLMHVWTGPTWAVINSHAFAPVTSFRHTQTDAATTWTVDHNLGATWPFAVHASFFVDTPDGLKPAQPADVTYATANRLTATFPTASTGVVLVRL